MSTIKCSCDFNRRQRQEAINRHRPHRHCCGGNGWAMFFWIIGCLAIGAMFAKAF